QAAVVAVSIVTRIRAAFLAKANALAPRHGQCITDWRGEIEILPIPRVDDQIETIPRAQFLQQAGDDLGLLHVLGISGDCHAAVDYRAACVQIAQPFRYYRSDIGSGKTSSERGKQPGSEDLITEVVQAHDGDPWTTSRHGCAPESVRPTGVHASARRHFPGVAYSAVRRTVGCAAGRARGVRGSGPAGRDWLQDTRAAFRSRQPCALPVPADRR